jgi:hypothetical protein
MKAGCAAFAWMLTAAMSYAQAVKPVGSVVGADAEVTRRNVALLPFDGVIVNVFGGATVTARTGHNAEVTLARGGGVLVCQSTALHLTATDDALLFALDRGAMEIRMKAGADDTVMTPDMRLTFAGEKNAELDLRIRVTFNGDTCVENRGRKAPQVNVSDAFGETAYLIKPGQHVLFEHGSLRSVVDRETTPCGCPPAVPAGVSIAEAVVRSGPATPEQAAAEHPFPAAISDGLAPGDAGPPTAVGERRVQVGSTLSYETGSTTRPAVAAPLAIVVPQSAAPASKPRRRNVFVKVGSFFKRLFVR